MQLMLVSDSRSCRMYYSTKGSWSFKSSDALRMTRMDAKLTIQHIIHADMVDGGSTISCIPVTSDEVIADQLVKSWLAATMRTFRGEGYRHA